jgi:hypothetical protein
LLPLVVAAVAAAASSCKAKPTAAGYAANKANTRKEDVHRHPLSKKCEGQDPLLIMLAGIEKLTMLTHELDLVDLRKG